MIAVDTNILVYAHREEMRAHGAARARLVELAEGPEPWALPVFCVGEFLRVITHPRLFDPPFGWEDALEALGRILRSPSLRILMPGDRYMECLDRAIREAGATGNLIFDAQVAALCREAGVRALLTEDRDFARFQGLTLMRL